MSEEMTKEEFVDKFMEESDNTDLTHKEFMNQEHILESIAYAAQRGWFVEVLPLSGLAAVRLIAAKTGYGLDILINDPDESVRKTAQEQLDK